MNTISGKHYEVTVKPLPQSLLNRTCSEPLITHLLTPTAAGSQRLQIRCPENKPWSLYMKGNIDIYVDVLISRHPLNKGERPQASDFTLREENISTLRRGYLSEFKQLENKQVANRVKAGEIIIPSMLTAEQIIQRGDRITITARNRIKNGGFTISMPGEALSNGALNQQIRIKNLSSGKILKGKIISPTEVVVE
ncbi:flagella basal body P-ring formation protein FlgA [Endozoicomonas sp. (ex Bugula neritina AB1)]|nr:flagella basal body P-ring formation protein FlgA [Endozoicomonas sp. (ex Bugula neritina AB1)]